ncbi:FxLD family lanthipeptide [Embleya sp. NPDC059259]|uniref:FxLD family lanthipeptide n=1 Tax=unclassified Embleya TaxID=2699296 RepID=UPI0036B40736
MTHDDHPLGGLALVDPPLPTDHRDVRPDEYDPDEFLLDVRLLVTLAPLAETACPTDDGCGNTCAGNASSCTSSMNALS